MVDVPSALPVTVPVVEPIVTLVLLALQVPLPERSVSVVLEPIQTVNEPEIAAGAGLMVTVARV